MPLSIKFIFDDKNEEILDIVTEGALPTTLNWQKAARLAIQKYFDATETELAVAADERVKEYGI